MHIHMNEHADTTSADETPGDPRTRRVLTVPNVLCAFRFVGAFALIGLAAADRETWFIGLFLVLLLTDWIDGRIARWFRQQSVIGARLDSVADATLYCSMMIGAWWLRPAALNAEWPWIAAAVGTYAVSVMASLIKFRQLPSYHTLLAKSCWLFVGVAGVALFADGPLWPLRVAMVVVTLTNLEAIALTCVLPEPRTDVRSILCWMKEQRAAKKDND